MPSFSTAKRVMDGRSILPSVLRAAIEVDSRSARGLHVASVAWAAPRAPTERGQPRPWLRAGSWEAAPGSRTPRADEQRRRLAHDGRSERAKGDGTALAGASSSSTEEDASAHGHQASSPVAPDLLPLDKRVIYRGAGMRIFRALVRMKIFQLAGVAGGGWLLAGLAGAGAVDSLQLAAATGLTAGAVGASATLWFYSRRYVGELSLLTPPGAAEPSHVRLSVLDFWGNRQDVDVPLGDLVPPAPPGVPRSVLAAPLVPVQALHDRQYYVSLRFGRALDPEKLRWLLTRDLLEREDAGAGPRST